MLAALQLLQILKQLLQSQVAMLAALQILKQLLQSQVAMLAALQLLQMLELLLQPRTMMLALEAKDCNRC